MADYQLLPDTTGAVIWRGMALPLTKSSGGYFKSKELVDLAWSSIILILTCPSRFRVMEPEFGAGLYEQVFEDVNSAAARVRDALNREIQKWDTRVVSVQATVNIVNENQISVFARFRVRGYPESVDRRLILGRQTLLGG
jgi:phage baseplate assembly protein W